jgi:hypothetical protein
MQLDSFIDCGWVRVHRARFPQLPTPAQLRQIGPLSSAVWAKRLPAELRMLVIAPIAVSHSSR